MSKAQEQLTVGSAIALLGLVTGLVSGMIAGLARRVDAVDDRGEKLAIGVEQRLTRIEEKLDRYFARNVAGR